MSNIEVFDKQIDDIKLSLDELKKETSVEQKNKKTESTKEKITKTKEEINKKLEELKLLWDATSLEEAKKLEEKLAILESISWEILSLENEIKAWDVTVDQEKWWLRRQRDGVTSKEEWKENKWTNVWRVAMWIWAVSVARRWIKKLFGIWKKNKETKESDWEKKGFWQTWLWKVLKRTGIWTWAYYLAHWIYTWNWWLWKFFDWSKEKNKLSFEESIPLVESDLWNISEWDLNSQRWSITYDEASWEIRSYWKNLDGEDIWTKIDKKEMKIDWLETKFSDYKELIFTANFINYLKFHYIGKWDDDSPFFPWNNTWDIYMRMNTEWKMEKKEVISWWMWSTLRKYAPSLDPSLLSRTTNVLWTTDTKWKERLCSYLNTLPWWKHKKAWYEYNESHQDDERNKKAMELQKEIEETVIEQDFGWTRWEIRAVKINDFEYDIESWSYKSKIKFNPEIKIDWMDISFPTVKEAIRTANFFNRMKKDYWWKCDKSNPFTIEYEYWDFALRISLKSELRKIKVLEDNTLKEKFPTVYDEKNRENFLNVLNNLPKEWNSFEWWM